ncbi:MAG: ATP-binding protein [Bacteroidetes bacterium]|nr:ATP-binding protein [Bacteroidota bacterium]
MSEPCGTFFFFPLLGGHFILPRGPIIICSQYACSEWTEQIEDPVNADALVDRLIHTPYKIFINKDGKGKSMREVFSVQ